MFKYNILMVYLVVGLVGCDQPRLNASNTPIPHELSALSLPMDVVVLEHSDGGGRLLGYYEWFLISSVKVLNVPEGFKKNNISSRTTILRVINVSKLVDIKEEDVDDYWAASGMISGKRYDVSCVASRGKWYLRIQRYP
jgi:hypothetical protein